MYLSRPQFPFVQAGDNKHTFPYHHHRWKNVQMMGKLAEQTMNASYLWFRCKIYVLHKCKYNLHEERDDVMSKHDTVDGGRECQLKGRIKEIELPHFSPVSPVNVGASHCPCGKISRNTIGHIIVVLTIIPKREGQLCSESYWIHEKFSGHFSAWLKYPGFNFLILHI